MKARHVGIALALAASQAAAQTPTLEFRGVPLGAPETAFRAANPRWHCGTTPDVLREFSDSYCNINSMDSIKLGDPALTNFGGTSVRVINASFIEGRFSSLAVTFTPEFYEQIVAALKAKFGAPIREASEPFQTKGGAVAENVIATWEFPNGRLIAQRYGASLNDGIVAYSSSDADAQIRQRGAARAKKGAGSL